MKSLVLFFATALFLASCSDPVEPTPTAPIVPGVGSTFSYATYNTNERGEKITGTDGQFVTTVVANNSTVSGNSGVWSIAGPNTDTMCFNIDTYKDLGFRTNTVGETCFDTTWVRLAIETGVEGTVSTSESLNGVRTVKSVTCQPGGLLSFTIAGKTIVTHSFKITYSIVQTTNNVETSNVSRAVAVWYAPSLGTFVRRTTLPQTWLGKQISGQVEELTGFTLK